MAFVWTSVRLALMLPLSPDIWASGTSGHLARSEIYVGASDLTQTAQTAQTAQVHQGEIVAQMARWPWHLAQTSPATDCSSIPWWPVEATNNQTCKYHNE